MKKKAFAESFGSFLFSRFAIVLNKLICFLNFLPFTLFLRVKYSISFYYEFSKDQDYICSKPEDSGMHLCANLAPYRIGPMICNGK